MNETDYMQRLARMNPDELRAEERAVSAIYDQRVRRHQRAYEEEARIRKEMGEARDALGDVRSMIAIRREQGEREQS
jgi:uncharacterized membrane protein